MEDRNNAGDQNSGWRSWWPNRERDAQRPASTGGSDQPSNTQEDTNLVMPNDLHENSGITEEATNNVNIRGNVNNTAAGWYSGLLSTVSSIPIFKGRNASIIIDANARYSQLNESQIKYLEDEATEAILRRTNSWFWYEDMTQVDREKSSWGERSGIASVQGTGSARCPLPLKRYPIPEKNPGYHVYLKDSLIIPSDSPLDILHHQSWMSKVTTTVKDYYNFPNEKHLYLKKVTDGVLRSEKILVISVVGNLPDKYEKFSLGEQRSAHYISTKLAQSLQHELPSRILSLSMECPLDSKDLKTVFQECIELLANWEHIFEDVTSIFFASVYHSVPLAILLAKHILENHQLFKFSPTTSVGLLAIESNIQGYRFWDHSTDAINSSERDYQKIKQAREKQLFQGVGKTEKEILSKIRLYRKLDSDESKLVQHNLDWLLFHWEGFRFNLFGKLFDNFMTASQKLAIDYTHPKIFRNLWCDGRYLGHNTKHPVELGIPDVHIKTPKFECNLAIPENRLFEISLLNCILLALNLGNTNFVPMMKLISPFFISRSFNMNTIPPNLKKQGMNELKTWLQEMDMKWRMPNSSEQYQDELPDSVSSVHKFLEFSQYYNIRSPELVNIYCEIYDDDFVYKTFIENTIKTRSPLSKKRLILLNDHSTPQSILNTVNQYDVVWKFHEFLSDYVKLRNLPKQEYPQCLNFAVSLEYSYWKQAYADAALFQRNNSEARTRLKHIWESYQSWDPPTTGLKQLRNVLSVLSLYNGPSELLQDIERK